MTETVGKTAADRDRELTRLALRVIVAWGLLWAGISGALLLLGGSVGSAPF